MGSEKKSNDRKNKKRSSSPISQDEGKMKKRRTVEEDEDRKRGKSSDKKEKRKSKKSHDSSKHRSDKDKKSGDKHKDKHRKRDRYMKLEIQELSNDDYFSKNNEFSTWLKEEKKTFFSDLSSESARELFSDFVKDWNKKKLEPRYYEGISSAPRTAHSWKIKYLKKDQQLGFARFLLEVVYKTTRSQDDETSSKSA